MRAFCIIIATLLALQSFCALAARVQPAAEPHGDDMTAFSAGERVNFNSSETAADALLQGQWHAQAASGDVGFVRSSCAMVEMAGWERKGALFNHVNMGSVSSSKATYKDCREMCARDNRCKAYTFRPQIGGDFEKCKENNWCCFLHADTIPAEVDKFPYLRLANSWAGACASSTADHGWLAETDYLGNDLAVNGQIQYGFDTADQDKQRSLCIDACKATSGCRAVTFRQDPEEGVTCFLKSDKTTGSDKAMHWSARVEVLAPIAQTSVTLGKDRAATLLSASAVTTTATDSVSVDLSARSCANSCWNDGSCKAWSFYPAYVQSVVVGNCKLNEFCCVLKSSKGTQADFPSALTSVLSSELKTYATMSGTLSDR